MEKDKQEKKPNQTPWPEKITAVAATLVALGISLGVNMRQVYAGDQNTQVETQLGIVQDKHTMQSEQGKIESQQLKIESQQMKVKSKQMKIESQQMKTDAQQDKIDSQQFKFDLQQFKIDSK
jgi:uncharacterized protein HemX